MFLPGLKAASSHDSSESSSGKGNGSSAARTEEEREHDLVIALSKKSILFSFGLNHLLVLSFYNDFVAPNDSTTRLLI
jgi:hypothetical protein